MTTEPSPEATPSAEEPVRPAGPPARRRRWVGPAVFLTLIGVPALILIFSNTESAEIHFAWAEWNAPLWVILAITFVAGAVVTRLLVWVWRTMRKRRRARTPEPSDSDGG